MTEQIAAAIPVSYPVVYSGDKVYAVHGKDKVEIGGLDNPSKAPAQVGKALEGLLKDMIEESK